MHQSQSFNYGPPPPQGQSPGQYATTQGPSSYPGYQHQQPQYPQGQQHPYQQPAQQPYVPQANSYQPQSQPFPPPGQPYSPQRSQYGLPTSSGPMPMPAQPYQQPQYGMPTFTPTPMSIPPQQGPGLMPGAGGFMSNLSPLSLMSAGGLLAAPQQYMQQKVGWLKTNMTGGTMSALFNISNSYVRSKMLMLLAPFLGRWTYIRHHEQIAGGQKYRPPSADVNAPDLYIPVMAMWTYALLACVVSAVNHKFKPELMSSMIYGASLAWGMHWLVARLILRGMNVPGVAWSELLAYTGYPFVPICLSIVAGCIGGKWAYYAVWGYGSLCMGIFLVKSMKRVIFQEARQYGEQEGGSRAIRS
eukprot:jgi/Chrzof1/8942/Cz03g30040.t1